MEHERAICPHIACRVTHNGELGEDLVPEMETAPAWAEPVPSSWGAVGWGVKVGGGPGLCFLPHPKAGAVPQAAGGDGVSLLLPEHLSLGGGGSYFWSLGTRVGGSAQLLLRCKSLTTRLPRQGPAVPWSLPRMRETCCRRDPGPLPTTSHRLLAWAASGRQQAFWRHWANGL